MLATVLFVVLAALAVLGGIAAPIQRDREAARNNERGKQSFYAAEAGVEDVLYRLKHGLAISPNETLLIGDSFANTSVADSLGGKTVTAEGDLNNLIRRVGASLKTGDGLTFAYAVQAGEGGFNLGNGATVIGNVYSNGDIKGHENSRITGSAYAANGLDPIFDQTNSDPSPPPQTIIFGNTNNTQDFAQSFKVATTGPLTKVRVYLKKVSTPNNLTVRLIADDNGQPADDDLDSTTLSSGAVTNNFEWVEVVFPDGVNLTPGPTYWLVFDGQTSSTKYYFIGANTLYDNGTGKLGRYQNIWNNTSPSGLDGYFQIYLDGLTATIEEVVIGTASVGDAWAHTIKEANVAGNLYCQVESGNNKTCDKMRADPSPQAFPISDGNINDWQTDAAAGQTITGNKIVSDTSVTLGPAKITGNLTVSNNAILTLTGTVWVQGNVILSNNSQIKLQSNYGAAGGILVVNGRVIVENNGTFVGSGQTGSYILVVTTSTCPDGNGCTGNAIDVSNNAGTVILNAQRGTISFAQNSGTTEATAKKIILANNATITYDSGLVSANFLSGPTGGFDITGWGETE